VYDDTNLCKKGLNRAGLRLETTLPKAGMSKAVICDGVRGIVMPEASHSNDVTWPDQ